MAVCRTRETAHPAAETPGGDDAGAGSRRRHAVTGAAFLTGGGTTDAAPAYRRRRIKGGRADAADATRLAAPHILIILRRGGAGRSRHNCRPRAEAALNTPGTPRRCPFVSENGTDVSWCEHPEAATDQQPPQNPQTPRRRAGAVASWTCLGGGSGSPAELSGRGRWCSPATLSERE